MHIGDRLLRPNVKVHVHNAGRECFLSQPQWHLKSLMKKGVDCVEYSEVLFDAGIDGNLCMAQRTKHWWTKVQTGVWTKISISKSGVSAAPLNMYRAPLSERFQIRILVPPTQLLLRAVTGRVYQQSSKASANVHLPIMEVLS